MSCSAYICPYPAVTSFRTAFSFIVLFAQRPRKSKWSSVQVTPSSYGEFSKGCFESKTAEVFFERLIFFRCINQMK